MADAKITPRNWDSSDNLITYNARIWELSVSVRTQVNSALGLHIITFMFCFSNQMADVKITARNCDSVAKDLQDAATSPSLPLLHQSILKFWINKQFRMSDVLWFHTK